MDVDDTPEPNRDKKPKTEVYIDYSGKLAEDKLAEDLYLPVKLVVGSTETAIRADRAILSKRSLYTVATFQGSTVESSAPQVTIQEVDE